MTNWWLLTNIIVQSLKIMSYFDDNSLNISSSSTPLSVCALICGHVSIFFLFQMFSPPVSGGKNRPTTLGSSQFSASGRIHIHSILSYSLSLLPSCVTHRSAHQNQLFTDFYLLYKWHLGLFINWVCRKMVLVSSLACDSFPLLCVNACARSFTSGAWNMSFPPGIVAESEACSEERCGAKHV